MIVRDQRGNDWTVIYRVISDDVDQDGYILLHGVFGELAWVGVDGVGCNHTNRHHSEVIVPAEDLAKFSTQLL